MKLIHEHFTDECEREIRAREGAGRRIGAELKFPMVNADGTAVDLETVLDFWRYLVEARGWEQAIDPMTGGLIGASKPGEQNHSVASCETGFCKSEFSLAHVADLFDLEAQIKELRDELRPFSEERGVFFLGYGIQPMTPPSKRLLMKRSRTSVWDKVFGANRILDREDGDDVNIFTVNAASHVHVGVTAGEAVRAVNVLNGFAGAQIGLTAHSNIWRGAPDPEYKCVAEKFWDWWIPEPGRVGVPEEPFGDLRGYVEAVARFKPVYVKRDGRPIVLTDYQTFAEYYSAELPFGFDDEGKRVELTPESEDIRLHFTCFWHNARLSRYYTVENRVNDQQPPGDLAAVSALTLGLVSALDEAEEELGKYDWGFLRASRDLACRDALAAEVGLVKLTDLAWGMLEVADAGLRRRGLGEERFLDPLRDRLKRKSCPADRAAALFADRGVAGLVDELKFS